MDHAVLPNLCPICGEECAQTIRTRKGKLQLCRCENGHFFMVDLEDRQPNPTGDGMKVPEGK
jgi:hypothetical protein